MVELQLCVLVGAVYWFVAFVNGLINEMRFYVVLVLWGGLWGVLASGVLFC